MRLIITRHGETEENKKHIMQGHMPGTLSKEGIEQAEKLSRRLKQEKIDAIFSSDLKRASDTTKFIARHHPEAELSITEDLREGNSGSFTGMLSHEINWDKRPPDAESINQMKDRARKFIDKILEQYSNKTILLVSHAGFNRCLIAQITGAKDPFKDVPDQQNTAVNIFEIYEDKSHKIHCLNCIKHLEIDDFRED